MVWVYACELVCIIEYYINKMGKDKYGQPITKDGHLNVDLMDKLKRENIGHNEVNLYYKHWNNTIEIDVGIAPLIYEIWKAGIHTNNCCEANMSAHEAVDEKDPECQVDYIWICFDGDRHLHKFLTIVFNNIDEDGQIYKRAFNISGNNRFRWTYDIHIDNDNDDFTNYDDDFPREINNSIRFPDIDYQFILNKFHEYNEIYNSSNDTTSHKESN